MRKFVLASMTLALTVSMSHADSFVWLDQTTSKQSMIDLQAKTSTFDLYGPSISDCSRFSCPSPKELDIMARRGTNVMKVSGGDIQMFDKIFAPMKKKTTQPEMVKAEETGAKFGDDMVLKTASIEPTSSVEPISLEFGAEPIALNEMPNEMPVDGYKTGPMPNGEKQADIAGVDTEFLPDITPDFEPEFAASIDEPSIVLENLSGDSMSALSNAM